MGTAKADRRKRIAAHHNHLRGAFAWRLIAAGVPPELAHKCAAAGPSLRNAFLGSGAGAARAALEEALQKASIDRARGKLPEAIWREGGAEAPKPRAAPLRAKTLVERAVLSAIPPAAK